MSTPILSGSGKEIRQSRATTIDPKSATLQLNRFPTGVGRYVIPPPPPPPIAAGYNYAFVTDNTTGGGYGWEDAYIEKYNFSSDTATAENVGGGLTVSPGPPPAPSNWNPYFNPTSYNGGTADAQQWGSNTHGFKGAGEGPPWLGNSPFWPLWGALWTWNYANMTDQTNNNDLFEPYYNSGGRRPMTDKVSGYGISAGGASGPSRAQQRIDTFPFATQTYSNNLSSLGTVVGTMAWDGAGGLSDNGAQANSCTAYNLEAGFMMGGRTNPNAGTARQIKFPYVSLTSNIRLSGIDTRVENATGTHSTINAYINGGITLPAPTRTTTTSTQKFPFATETDLGVTSVSDLTYALASTSGAMAGFSSDTSAKIAGDGNFFGTVKTVQGYPFAADTVVSLVGSLIHARGGVDGRSEG